MAKSLQDQLLQAGVADKKKAEQVRQEKRKQKKKQKQKGASAQDEAAEQRRLAAEKARQERAEKDKALARQQQEEAERRERLAQVRQLVETQKVSTEDGDVPYQFVDGKKVRKVYVTQSMVDRLADGRLAIARLGSGFEVIPAATAQKVQERDEGSIVCWNQATGKGGSDDDPYADFPIPDDLMW